jgi:hypothetical protein
MEFKENQVHSATMPFVKWDNCFEHDQHVFYQPGMRVERDGSGETWMEADAQGRVQFKIIKVVEMPKPYSTKILFVRRYIEPNGKTLKWSGIEMRGISAFKKLISGDRWNYELKEDDDVIPA